MAARKRLADERDARRRLILEAAESLFVDKGYGATSVNDIAEAADFSRTSIYQYFSNKEEIYVSILSRYTDELTERVAAATALETGTREKICAFLQELRAMIGENPSFFDLFFIQRHQLEATLPVELKRGLNAKRKELENVFREFYARGVERGEVRDIRVKDASNLFFAQITGMILLRQYYEDEFDVSLDYHLDRSLELYLEFVGNVDSSAALGAPREAGGGA